VIAKFEFEAQIRKLERSNLLYKVVSKFCDIDLHPERARTSRWATCTRSLRPGPSASCPSGTPRQQPAVRVPLLHRRVCHREDLGEEAVSRHETLQPRPELLPLHAPLSELIARLNERFGADLSEADRLHLEGIGADMAADPEVQQQAAANTKDNFGIEFDKRFTDAVAARMHQAEDLTIRILDAPEFRAEVIRTLMPRVYERARVAHQKTCPIGELLARKEDKHLGFKSSLRWDRKSEEKSKLVEAATIKTVAAFLNSEYGGTLLIGVDDRRTVVGLETDYATLRKEGKDDADAVDDHGQFSKKPVFFVRLNNGTRAIPDEMERQRYIAQRWGG
jgi:hypothetical protein